MRALKILLTAAGFAATFAILILASAVLTATVHKALSANLLVAMRS